MKAKTIGTRQLHVGKSRECSHECRQSTCNSPVTETDDSELARWTQASAPADPCAGCADMKHEELPSTCICFIIPLKITSLHCR